MDDVTNRVTPTAGPSNDKYSLSHMMNFLASVKTPAELKMLENNATQKDVTREAGSGNNNTEQNDDDLEVGEDASTYDAKRIKFGNLGFISRRTCWQCELR